MMMASTTSAAATMLLSESMPSPDGIMNSTFHSRTMFPCSPSLATISASAPFPTITLDLTHNPNLLQQYQRPQTQFHVPFQNLPQNFSPAGSLPFNPVLQGQSKFSAMKSSLEAQPPQARAEQVLKPLVSSSSDSVTAATAAIATDPNFTAALVAAITSVIGNVHPNNSSNSNSSTNVDNNIGNSNFVGN